jgi:DNA repair protein RecO (recombination protein O)
MPVSVDALRYFRHFQRSTYEQAVKAQPEERVRREWEALMQHYLTYLLERGLNSTAFVLRLPRMNQAG